MRKRGEVIPEQYDWIVWSALGLIIAAMAGVALYNWAGIMLNGVHLAAM